MQADAPVRRLSIRRDEVAPYIYRRANVGDSAASMIPNADALRAVEVLARPDGLYVVQLTIDPAGGFDLADLDELAYAVAMVAKGRLGHTHYHHNMPGEGRATALKPSQILYVAPVQLEGSGWATRFRQSRLSDADALAARAASGPGRTYPSAVLELRHRYIRLEDALNFRVRLHRETQTKRLQGAVGRLSFLAYGLGGAGAMFFLVLPNFREHGVDDIVSLILTSLLIALGLRFRARIATWDVPVIRLLRTGHGFFTSADLYNRVAEGVLRSGGGTPQVDSFSNLLANLETRIEGEQHRIGMGQNWLALTVGAASLVAAISALKHADKPKPPDRPAEAAQPRTPETPPAPPAPPPPAQDPPPKEPARSAPKAAADSGPAAPARAEGIAPSSKGTDGPPPVPNAKSADAATPAAEPTRDATRTGPPPPAPK